MAVFEANYHIGIRNVGINKLVTNEGILSILEDVACMHSDIAGYGFKTMDTTHLTWVLLHWKVKILKRAEYGTNITVKTWARKCTKISTLRDFELYDKNNELFCIASSKWTLIDLNKGSITKITDEILNSYEPEEKSVFAEDDIPRIFEPNINEETSNYSFQVQRRDIDVNKHMHNLYYLDYAYGALPKEIYEAPEYNNIEIYYKNGAKLGEKIHCFYMEKEKEHYVVMKNIQDNKLNAIIKLS